MHKSIEAAITTMRDRYAEPLTLNDLAASVVFSKFHFSRVFRSSTGVSPGRYLSVIRLYEAKKLLLATSLNVTVISYEVGYTSLGTFTSRFSRSVCLSPARYRSLSYSEIPLPTIPPSNCSQGTGAVRGLLSVPPCQMPLHVYIGAFRTPIPESAPGSCDLLEGSGCYRLAELPAGQWRVMAIAVAYTDLDPRPWLRKPVFVCDPVTVSVPAGQEVSVDIGMRTSSPFDLPVLMAVPELDGMRAEDPARLLRTVG